MPNTDYPRMMFHRTKQPVTVQTRDEEDALGKEWSRTIWTASKAAAPEPEPEPDPPEPEEEPEEEVSPEPSPRPAKPLSRPRVAAKTVKKKRASGR
jgi:hypothetical protein